MRLLDPTWLGAIASILAIILTIFFYYKAKQKKSLSYEILSEHPLVSVHDEIKERLQILVDGVQTENVYLLLLRLTNDGTIPISAVDYERPISVEFSDDSSILSAEPMNAQPTSLTPCTSVKEKIVSIKPVLMNPGDSFTTKILLSQYNGSFNVDARILGIKELRVTRRQDRVRRGLFVGLASAVVSVFLIVLVGDSVIKIFTDPPVITKLEIDKDKIKVKEGFQLSFSAIGKEVKYDWPRNRNATGTAQARGYVVTGDNPNSTNGTIYMVAPAIPGRANIEVSFSDRWGRQDIKSILIEVVESD